MGTYHHTDTLGRALEAARSAVSSANGALGDLGAELTAEREMHRAEVMRLVERAEEAELERDRLEAELAELHRRVKRAADARLITNHGLMLLKDG